MGRQHDAFVQTAWFTDHVLLCGWQVTFGVPHRNRREMAVGAMVHVEPVRIALAPVRGRRALLCAGVVRAADPGRRRRVVVHVGDQRLERRQ